MLHHAMRSRPRRRRWTSTKPVAKSRPPSARSIERRRFAMPSRPNPTTEPMSTSTPSPMRDGFGHPTRPRTSCVVRRARRPRRENRRAGRPRADASRDARLRRAQRSRGRLQLRRQRQVVLAERDAEPVLARQGSELTRRHLFERARPGRPKSCAPSLATSPRARSSTRCFRICNRGTSGATTFSSSSGRPSARTRAHSRSVFTARCSARADHDHPRRRRRPREHGDRAHAERGIHRLDPLDVALAARDRRNGDQGRDAVPSRRRRAHVRERGMAIAPARRDRRGRRTEMAAALAARTHRARTADDDAVRGSARARLRGSRRFERLVQARVVARRGHARAHTTRRSAISTARGRRWRSSAWTSRCRSPETRGQELIRGGAAPSANAGARSRRGERRRSRAGLPALGAARRRRDHARDFAACRDVVPSGLDRRRERRGTGVPRPATAERTPQSRSSDTTPGAGRCRSRTSVSCWRRSSRAGSGFFERSTRSPTRCVAT